MPGKYRLLSNMHKILREDPYINQLCRSFGIEIDSIELILQDIYNQFWFDTMTWGAGVLAAQLKVKLDNNLTQEEKNSLLEARWKSSGKSDVFLLQTICDSWKNGEIDVSFINGKIQIKFIGEYGIPTDLTSLKTEINKSKPAHLAVEYLFKYFLISDIHEVMTLEELENSTLDKFTF